MDDRQEPLLDCLAEHGVREYLHSLGGEDLVVGDAETLDELGHLPADTTSFQTAHIDELPAAAPAPAPVQPIVVWTGRLEAQRVRRVQRLRPDAQVVGLIGDLLPRLAAGQPIDAQPTPAPNGYVILCAPRTGSYHLCALLDGLGLGTPDEHLDQGLCTAARRGHVDLHAYLDTLRCFAVQNGWFGTKLISHVLFAAFDSGLSAPDFLAWLQRHRLRVLLLSRDDRCAQAVSNYVARSNGVWTATGAQPVPPRPPYDFEQIHADWRELRQQEAWLEQFVQHLPEPPYRIRYEDLDREPERVLRGVVAWLTDGGESPLPFQVRPRTRKLRDEVSVRYAQRFADELRARGGE